MILPNNYIIERRDVKHIRLVVTEKGEVKLYAPLSTSDSEIDLILAKRKFWIESKLAFFKNRQLIKLKTNEILLFGKPYSYIYDSFYGNRVTINNDSRVITAKKNLTDINIQEKWLKSVAKKYLKNRMDQLSTNLKLRYNRLFIRTQKSKWGNCSKEKNISINWKLIKCPEFVIDYVCIHELCHTKIMNHTERFSTLLKSLCPEEENARMWLDKYGAGL